MAEAKPVTSDYAVGTEAALPPVVIEAPRRPRQMILEEAAIEKYYQDQRNAPAPEPVAALEGPPGYVALKTPQFSREPAPAVEPPVEPTPATEPPTESTPVVADPSKDTSWEHQYLSSQGRLRAERMRADSLEANVVAMQAQLATMQAQLANPQQHAALGPLADLTPDEASALGPEMLDYINRRAAIIARSEVGRLQAQIDNMQNNFQQTAQQRAASAKAMFMADMDTLVPDWAVINKDPKFEAWCDETDLMSGRLRRDNLLDAWNSNNTQRVVAIFNMFGNSAYTKPPNGAAPQPAAGNQPQNKLPLEAFVAPGKGNPGTLPAQPPKPASIWTGNDINSFYSDVRKGRFRGREQEQHNIEADLMLAQAEGRVRP